MVFFPMPFLVFFPFAPFGTVSEHAIRSSWLCSMANRRKLSALRLTSSCCKAVRGLVWVHAYRQGQNLTGRKKGGFVKGWFWRTYPRSGFRSGGTCEVPSFRFFVPGNMRSFRFSFRGNIRQNKPPFFFWVPPKIITRTLELILEREELWPKVRRRGSYKSLFLPNSGRSSQEK